MIGVAPDRDFIGEMPLDKPSLVRSSIPEWQGGQTVVRRANDHEPQKSAALPSA